MKHNYFEIDEDIYYNKNGTVKAYEALIYHKELGKNIKVRNRDRYIYDEKYKEAIQTLELEWKVVEDNEKIKEKINSAVNNHILATEMDDFNYKKFKLDRVRELLPMAPEKPHYLPENQVPEKPNSEMREYIFQAKWYQKLFGIDKTRQNELNKKLEKDIKDYETLIKEIEKTKKENKEKKEKYEKLIGTHRKKREELEDYYDEILSKCNNDSEENINIYFNSVLKYIFKINNPFNETEYNFYFDQEDATGVLDFYLPTEKEVSNIKEYKFIKTHKEIREVFHKDKDYNNILKKIYYSMYISCAYKSILADKNEVLKNLVVNGYYNGIDKRKGKEFKMCIMTSKINVKEFNEINFNRIEPKDTFKYFSGKGVPDAQNLIQVEPIRFKENERFRLIDSTSVIGSLSADTNLAAIDWKDFETLIKDVFELEFKEQDIVIKNTQHSNDGGIDVVAFNNNPYTGGIILLQAKRYTNTVSPEPVRALKGSMEEHKAIRGIMVTTSGYGKSSIEYAKEHNITLINGEQLVDLFKKHGYGFHINLEQAKIINGNR